MTRRRQRGVALLVAMVVVALVVTAAGGIVWQQTRAVELEAAERARRQATWILAGALDWARLILREDGRTNRMRPEPYDSLDEPWATPLAEARLSTFLAADADNTVDSAPEAFISGAIADAQSRLNLRSVVAADGTPAPAPLEGLRRLCDLVGVAPETASQIAVGLGRALAPATVGEDGVATTPADRPLLPARLEDLAWLGVDAAALQRLAAYVELLPGPAPVNLNTASPEVIVAAIDGIALADAERIVQARARAPLKNLVEVQALLAPTVTLDATRVAVMSSYFDVAGRLRLDDRVLEERSLLVRRGNRVDVLRRERRSSMLPAG